MENLKLRATPAARTLAKRLGVNLANVSGTGYKGRIHSDDVAGFNYEKKIHVSPLARKIADEFNIDLKGITGSGYNGKVMKEDVLLLIADPKAKEHFSRDEFDMPTLPKPTTVHVQQTTSAPAKTPITPAPAPAAGETQTVPMSMMRSVIARRMSESYFGAPTFIQNWEVDMTEMLALRKQLIDPVMQQTGKKLTVTDLLSMAVARTLMKHPYINASLSADAKEITFHNYVNLAMAVGLDDGLLVPVVKNVERMTLAQLVTALKDVTERTFSKKLLPDEQTGSTFTISNLGMYGVNDFSAIINQPNAAILSVAATIEKPVARNGQVVVRPMMNMGLTSDHRLIDGLTAAKFMTDLKQLIENPLPMLI